jgi:hypothetical protein
VNAGSRPGPVNISHSYLQYAAAERGYEERVDWTEESEEAERDSTFDRSAGLDSRVIQRLVTVHEWTETEQ